MPRIKRWTCAVSVALLPLGAMVAYAQDAGGAPRADITGSAERALETARGPAGSRVPLVPQPATIPLAQRLHTDYGGFISVDYLTLQDRNRDNHVLREYDLVCYAGLDLDECHEVYIRGRTGYRDFHTDDSFDGRGDQPIDPDFDRGYQGCHWGNS